MTKVKTGSDPQKDRTTPNIQIVSVFQCLSHVQTLLAVYCLAQLFGFRLRFQQTYPTLLGVQRFGALYLLFCPLCESRHVQS